eukprot:9063497-Karenia_brevis.AAC.1
MMMMMMMMMMMTVMMLMMQVCKKNVCCHINLMPRGSAAPLAQQQRRLVVRPSQPCQHNHYMTEQHMCGLGC